MRVPVALAVIAGVLPAQLDLRDLPPAEARDLVAREALRQRLLQLLRQSPGPLDEQMQAVERRLVQDVPPSAVVVMPERNDVVRLHPRNGLELRHDGPGGADVTCGGCNPMYPGPFTARAFVANEILVTMRTSNGTPETTLMRFVRADGNADFVVTEHRIGGLTWKDPGSQTEYPSYPGETQTIAWDAASGTATVAFCWEGVQQVAVAQVPFVVPEKVAIESPGAHRRVRRPPIRQVHQVQAEGLGKGVAALALDVGGELYVCVRQATQVGRAGTFRVHVRDRGGAWSKSTADVQGVRVEPEFTLWQDTDGRVCLTTPVTDPTVDLANPEGPAAAHTLLTFRMAQNAPTTWQLAPMQFAWSGRLQQGLQLRVVTAPGQPPTLVLQTTAGEPIRVSLRESQQPQQR